MTVWDLSHPVSPGMTVVPGLPDVHFKPLMSMSEGALLDVCEVSMPSHAGTHLDAPSHAIISGRTIDQIRPEELIGHAVVVDASHTADRLIDADDFKNIAGLVNKGDYVFVSTGYETHFGTDRYFDYPSFHENIVDWAVEQEIRGIGADTLSPDLPRDKRPADFDMPLHRQLLGRDILIIENLRNLIALRGRRVSISIGVVSYAGKDAGPARILAWDAS